MGWRASRDPSVQARWRGRVATQQTSGLSVVAFATQHSFSAESLRRWRRWFEAQRQADVQVPALIEVRIEDPAPAPRRDSMVLELPSGHCIHLQPGFDTSAVARLISILVHP